MKIDFLENAKAWLLVFLFLVVGVTDARADIYLTDDLILSGMARQTCVYSMGTKNPNLTEKADFNLMRTLFQAELNYRPTDIFRFYFKGRVNYDQTDLVENNLSSYDSVPWTYETHHSDLRTRRDDNISADIWEVWANIELADLWVRLGKQQIAWGDLVSVRVADNINPLDKSWHLVSEPEEFENIRIPEWAARVYYTLPEEMSGPFAEIFIDAYINPGDIHPDIQPATGSPYQNAFSYLAGDENFDRRGDTEWGARLGFNLGQFQTTLNYMSVHMDYPVWDVPNPPNHTVYPEIDIYAMTLNYAFEYPIATSVQFEGSYTPDYMWQSTAPGPPAMEEGAWWKTAIILERDFNLFPKRKFMTVRLMWYRHWVDNRDRDKVKLSPAPLSTANRLDWGWDLYMLQATQVFGPGGNYNHEATGQFFWCPEGSYQFKFWYNWKPTEHWRFDLGAMWQGGGGDRAFLHSNNSWNDELYGRITYFY